MKVLRMIFVHFNPLPRKEGDIITARARARKKNFNPLPRKEGDQMYAKSESNPLRFQSTPS